MTEATTAATTAAATTTAAAATTAAATTTTEATWHGLTDPTQVAYVENKGWKSFGDALGSYQGAEKIIGRDPTTLVTLPRADDPVALRTVFSKLGLPEKADAYVLDTPPGVDAKTDPFVAWSKNTFHKVGLLPAQAKELSAEYNKFLGENATRIAGDYTAKLTADKQTLLKEWGAGHERMMNVAQGAFKALGFTREMGDALEQEIGYAATMKFFAALGGKMSEDQFPTGEGKKNFDGAMLTPVEAKAQWDEAKMDPNFTKALSDKSHPGHAVAQAKQNRLFAIMYPAG